LGDPAESRPGGGPSTAGAPAGRRRAVAWYPWLVGAALLGAVVAGALHFSDERDFVRIVEKAQPWWVGVAVVLQAATYLAQGESWRVLTRAAGVRLPLSLAYRLSLAKLFVDQALPSAGISGMVVVARALEQRGVPRAVVMALVVVGTVAYYAVYVLALAAALVVAVARGRASPLIIGASVLFVVASLGAIAAFLALAGPARRRPRLTRIPLLGQAMRLLGEADPRLARSGRLIFWTALYQLAIVLLDAATLWVLVRSLGERASPAGVFASFMISSLLRTIGLLPGDLGIFEAASVVTLKLAGVSIPVALSATLLFRVLSFWLPMAPGLLFSRAARGPGDRGGLARVRARVGP
jgi:P-type Mg2+ transporter